MIFELSVLPTTHEKPAPIPINLWTNLEILHQKVFSHIRFHINKPAYRIAGV